MRLLSRILLILCLSPIAVAQQATSGSPTVVPTLVNFTGVVRDINGRPLTGTVGLTFAMYKDAQGGPALWIETQNVQADKGGNYSVMLGAASSQGLPADLFAAGEARWLGVQISGQEERPRVLLLSVPYALKAADSQTLGGLPPSAFMLANSGAAGSKPAGATPPAKSSAALALAASPASSNVTTTGGTVHSLPLFTTATNIQSSIVSQAGTSSIDVKGQLNVGQGEPTDGILNSAPNSSSHVGLSTRGWSAAKNSNASGGDAIHVTGGSGDPTGLDGGGTGIVITGGVGGDQGGTALSATGGVGNGSGGSGAGDAIVAQGGSGEAGGVGVIATAGDMEADGIISTGSSSRAFGMGGNGVVGTGGSGDGSGGDGILGVPGPGVNGGPAGFAGEFQGNVDVTGNLTVAGTKSFRIDHPLDPANKYLFHAALESSEVLDLYSGNVTLDHQGEAIVQLPDWFESLNRDFRYQLTAIGAAAPNLHISQEIQNHNFTIAGGAPGTKVSWQVTGVRQDAWEKQHPMAVEAEKPSQERGYYINPELFGAPPQRGITWARHSRTMKRLKAIQEKQAQERANQKQANLANLAKSAQRQ